MFVYLFVAVTSFETDTPTSSTLPTKSHFLSNNGTGMTTFSPTEAILTTTHYLMTSLVTANRSHLPSTRPITYTKETFPTPSETNTRKPVTVKQNDSDDVTAKTLTQILSTQTITYSLELIHTKTTTQKYSDVSTNGSTVMPVEHSTDFSNFSSPFSGEYTPNTKKVLILYESKYQRPFKFVFYVRCYFFHFFKKISF